MESGLITPGKIDKFIVDFKQKFYLKFGIFPIVTYNIDKTPAAGLEATELLEVMNELLYRNIAKKNSYTEGIFTKNRYRLVVIHRQIFFKIALDAGFSCTYLAKLSGYDHVTILYSRTTIDTLMESKNIQVLYLLDEAMKMIEEKSTLKHSVL